MSLLSIGKSALFASYAQMQTTSNNIANANTVGYSRQSAMQVTGGSLKTGAGFFGTGVDVATITRSYNQFLSAHANSTNSASTADTARLDKLTQLEAVFSTGKSGIGYAAGQLLNSFVDVANTPGDSSARQVALSQATQLASMLRAGGSQISALQRGLAQDVRSTLGTVNGLASQVAALNSQITASQSAGQAPNDLLDQRDRLINQIGSYVDVSTIAASDGSIGVFIGGGQTLVLGANANSLSTVADPFDSSKVQVAVSTAGGPPVVVPSATITGGSIGGLLKVQNTDLPAAANLLGQMATAVTAAMNKQQALGLDLNGRPGAAMFSIGAPQAISASTNHGTASMSIAVSDATQVLASDYKLHFDGSNYALTRLSDNTAAGTFTPAQLAAGISVDGMTVQRTAGSASAGDDFLLRPVANAAQTMQTVLADPRGIAAAAPFTASMPATNTGTATVASLTATSTGYNPALSASISFTSNSGAYTWSLSDGSSGTGTWSAGNPISLNGFALQLSGVPKSGDSFSVAPTSAVAANNGNAQAFVNLASTAMVAGQTVTDAYAGAIADIGVRVQGATTASTASTAAAAAAQTANADSAGVNLDEEASRLIQYQQSYQAAAKVLSTAQSIFSALMQAVGG